MRYNNTAAAEINTNNMEMFGVVTRCSMSPLQYSPLGEMAPTKGAASSGEGDSWLIILEEIRRLQAVDGDPICGISNL